MGMAITGMLARAMNTLLANGFSNCLMALAVIRIAPKYTVVLKIKYQLVCSPNKSVVVVIGNGANGRFENSGNQEL
jgi:hypothetical protein